MTIVQSRDQNSATGCSLSLHCPSNCSPRLIALHLPQYHPIPENDEWWGKGFTEWTNVTRVRPQFHWHEQPHLPADLGYYDLRLSETRVAQAELASAYGVSGFCYYHYWFNGRRLLHRPVDEIVSSGVPDFPFCLCWANENWTRAWDGGERQILLAQHYSTYDDLDHIRFLLPRFADPRYIRLDGKPLFLVYRVGHLPEPKRTAELWRDEARRAGLGELYLATVENPFGDRHDPKTIGFDAAIEFAPDWNVLPSPLHTRRVSRWLMRIGFRSKNYLVHRVHEYADLAERMMSKPERPYPWFRCVTPGWDNSARRKVNATIFRGSTPTLYESWLRHTVVESLRANKPVVFVNGWNEWAEGNHLEPCQRWGRQYLEATQRVMVGARR